MPPAIQRALSRASLPSTSPRGISSLTRAFSSTTLLQTNKIPPESPLYINVPIPPLSQAVEDAKAPRFAHKGHLPPPRRIFKRRTYEIRKTSPTFLAKSAPLPTSAKSQLPPTSESEAWKRRMASVRRKNLEEGITQLWERKKTTDKERLDHRHAKLRHHRNAMMAPQRHDETFTESSIPASVLQTEVPRDPARFERALASQARTNALNELKGQNRKDALQHLYMSARSFIVDEQTLEKEVERLFRPNYFTEGATGSGLVPTNAWDFYGKPQTVQDMMGGVLKTDYRVVMSENEDSSRTTKRQKSVAEELTGGPMDDA
ncbi:hypothetical protein BJ170DRAFT_600086 [Xylariales sp. AK1849]|nr:hypothetical protein BJ170DRAFT_600086 [Xylariales sp. AK1849]